MDIRIKVLAACAIVAFSAVGLEASARQADRVAWPDQIFVGRFLTLDPARPQVEAIAVTNGRIVALGSRAEIEALAGGKTKKIKVPGVGVPGWADAHVHNAEGDPSLGVDLRGLPKQQILDEVAKLAKTTPSGQEIRATGWDESFFTPSAFPTAADLDAVSGDHPVVLDRLDGHATWVNSRVLRNSGITRTTADPPGGRIVRSASGEATGILVDNAMDLIQRAGARANAPEALRRMRTTLQQYARLGYTGIHVAGLDLPTIDTYKQLLKADGDLPVRAYLMATGDPAIRHYLQQGPESNLGDGQLSVRSIKLLIDGALGSRGALLAQPYSDAPGEVGLSMMDDGTFDTYIKQLREKGFQVNVHAIGDKGVKRVLDAFERNGVKPMDRFRIEHASMISPTDLPRFARLGVIASMQPMFLGEYGRWGAERIGPERLKWLLPIRDLLATGAIVACGSDFNATDSGNPIYTLSALVTRTGADGGPPGGLLPEQAVDVDAALRCMSTGPAFAAFQEKDLGALTIGRYADFTVLSADPHAVLPEELRNLTVRMTVMGGRVRFEAAAPVATTQHGRPMAMVSKRGTRITQSSE